MHRGTFPQAISGMLAKMQNSLFYKECWLHVVNALAAHQLYKFYCMTQRNTFIRMLVPPPALYIISFSQT